MIAFAICLTRCWHSKRAYAQITGVKVSDVVPDNGAACVRLRGKGRKQRSVPLWPATVKVIRAWLKLNQKFDATSALLPNRSLQFKRASTSRYPETAFACRRTRPS